MSNIHQISVPKLGEGVHFVKVVRILRETGEWVDEDSDLVEIETDKATYEVPAPASGYISKILCAAGQNLNVGEVMFEMEDKVSAPTPSNQQKRKGDQLQELHTLPVKRKLPSQQQALIEKLHESQDIIVPATIEKQINWDTVERIRKTYRTSGHATETPSAMEIISYSTATAMHNYEKFRAKLSHDNHLEISDDSRIGIALSLPDDVLVTPAVSVHENNSQNEVFKSIREKILDFKNKPETAQSKYHSVTISSMSSLGVISAKPVVVYPAVATLFIGAPFYAIGQSREIEKLCKLILTFDHRLINGAYAAKFLGQIEKNILSIESNLL